MDTLKDIIAAKIAEYACICMVSFWGVGVGADLAFSA